MTIRIFKIIWKRNTGWICNTSIYGISSFKPFPLLSLISVEENVFSRIKDIFYFSYHDNSRKFCEYKCSRVL